MSRSLELGRALLGQSASHPAWQAVGFLLFLLTLAVWNWSLRRRLVLPGPRRALRAMRSRRVSTHQSPKSTPPTIGTVSEAPSDGIPMDSILRESIGGSRFSY